MPADRTDDALALAEMGYRVFPCIPDGKAPATPNGCLNASADWQAVEAMFTAVPGANVGLATDGLFVLDIDGGDNPFLTPERGYQLSRSPLCLTPSGGRHYYFRQPKGAELRNTAGRVAPNVDTRANGGYVVAPPSEVGGRAYRWLDGFELRPPSELGAPPPWLLKALSPPAGRRPLPAGVFTGAEMGSRNVTAASLAGMLLRRFDRLDRDGIRIAFAAFRGWNLNNAPPLEDDELRRTFESILKRETRRRHG